jgi:hypothetical protein
MANAKSHNKSNSEFQELLYNWNYRDSPEVELDFMICSGIWSTSKMRGADES